MTSTFQPRIRYQKQDHPNPQSALTELAHQHRCCRYQNVSEGEHHYPDDVLVGTFDAANHTTKSPRMSIMFSRPTQVRIGQHALGVLALPSAYRPRGGASKRGFGPSEAPF